MHAPFQISLFHPVLKFIPTDPNPTAKVYGNKVANNEEERIMRNMLYYTFYKKNPAKCGFQSIDEEMCIRDRFGTHENTLEAIERIKNL